MTKQKILDELHLITLRLIPYDTGIGSKFDIIISKLEKVEEYIRDIPEN